MSIISSIAGLVSFVVGIVVLIKLFQKEGALKGILGFICMLYTYIWGWRNAKSENLTTIMWIWTGVIIVSVIISAIAGPSMMPPPPDAGGGEIIPTEEALRLIVRLFA